FLNELIWAYDYGAKPRRRWPQKHDTILVYVKDPAAYYFDADGVDREPYMAPGLVTPEQVERGKRPVSVIWHTIVSPTGRENTDYNQGLSMPFAIERGVTVTATARDDGRMVARALDLGESDEFPLDNTERDRGWRAFVRGTVGELRAAGHDLRPATLEIAGD